MISAWHEPLDWSYSLPPNCALTAAGPAHALKIRNTDLRSDRTNNSGKLVGPVGFLDSSIWFPPLGGERIRLHPDHRNIHDRDVAQFAAGVPAKSGRGARCHGLPQLDLLALRVASRQCGRHDCLARDVYGEVGGVDLGDQFMLFRCQSVVLGQQCQWIFGGIPLLHQDDLLDAEHQPAHHCC